MSIAQEHPGAGLVVVGTLQTISLGVISLVLANAGLMFFYVVYDLTLIQLVLIYWLESLWIGIFCALKLITASVLGDPFENKWLNVSAGAGLISSFIAIMLVGGKFVGLFGMLGLAIGIAGSAVSGISAHDIFFDEIGLLLGTSGLFIAAHGISFIANFILRGEFRTARVATLLALPFKRSLALMAAIVVAYTVSLVVPVLASTTGFAAVLIFCKLAWDYRLHRLERIGFADDSNSAVAR